MEKKAMRLKCLRCVKSYGVPEADMGIIGYTKYSYCEDCLREGLKLLQAKDKARELREPLYVIDTPLGRFQTYNGMPMAFKSEYIAEEQIRETEMVMRKHGHGALCGIMFVRPLTLEKCGKKKHDFVWREKTIGDEEREQHEQDNANPMAAE